MNYLTGYRIIVSNDAVSVRRVAVIERCKVVKRRRRWTLHYETKIEPGAYQVGGDLMLHPDAYAKLVLAEQANWPGY